MLSRFERQRSPEDALRIAEATFERLGLHTNLLAYGHGIKTYHCKLIDAHHKTIFYGCGKGLGVQSKVSACFEALEHYVVHMYCQQHAELPEHYVALNHSEIMAKLKSLNLLDPTIFHNHNSIPCVPITNIVTGERLLYPLFMVDPRYGKNPARLESFDYTSYLWKACDSGIASGTSHAEASLHALNESIERDAFSLFLINTFMLNYPIRIIDKDSLPHGVQQLIHDIEADYEEDLLLVDVTSDIGVPTFFVTMTKQPMLIQPRGCGTSLNKHYALERAILESLQPLHLHNKHLANNQQHILDNLAQTPLLAKCAKADLLPLKHNAQNIDFNDLPSFNDRTSIEMQLSTIIQRIHAQGFSIFTMTIAHMDSGFHCVKYIIPEFEQFHLVEIGKKILPNNRGMALIRSNKPNNSHMDNDETSSLSPGSAPAGIFSSSSV